MNRSASAASAAGPGTAAQAGLARARTQSRHQVIGLALQFLLGMAVNLLGLPSQTTGTAHAATTAFLVAHIAVAAGLLANAYIVVLFAARAGSRWRGSALWGAAAIVVTLAAGILTLSTKSNWWSYAMAAGFISSLLIYGGILIQSGAPPASPSPG